MKTDEKWTIGIDSDIKALAIKYCAENNLTFKEYANKRLDPDCPNKMQMRRSGYTDKNRRFNDKTVEQLLEEVIEKKIKKALNNILLKE